MSEAKSKKPMHKRWWFWPVVVFFGLGAIGSLIPESPAAKAEREKAEAQRAADAAAEDAAAKAEQQAKAEEAQKKAAAEKERGFHCLNAFDGSHDKLKELVVRNLRNPRSFKHDETRITPKDEEGKHTVMMRYRAENGFGGMAIEVQVARIDHETCEIVELVR